MWISLSGGLGMFLLGMALLTDGLKSFAGDALRTALLRFTRRPIEAFLSGAVVTAMVQSSSATTLATIGFVSAGLLPFAQAVGVLIGASLGTTSTGWLVSLFGLKLSIAKAALPLVAAGAFLKLLGRGRWKALGLALAGLGLIFVGIDYLQTGMEDVAENVDLSRLPSTGFLGHALMMLVGVGLTILMQSSSAAVATALSALHAGALGFEQSTSLVIGAAIGTTTTAAIACIGAGSAARRTALAHILFNLATGVVALVLLPVFLSAFDWAGDTWGFEEGAIALAAFHTTFIAIGVLIFLPWTSRFASFVERLVPHRGSRVTRHLEDSLLEVPAVALEAAAKSLREITSALTDSMTGPEPDLTTAPLREDVGEIRRFLSRIPAQNYYGPAARLRVDCVHALDHITRLLNLARKRPPLGDFDPEMLKAYREQLGAAKESVQNGSSKQREIEQVSKDLAKTRREVRSEELEKTGSGIQSPEHAEQVLSALRWIDGAAYHTWRLVHHLQGTTEDDPEVED